MSEDREEKRSFTVADKRRFSESGDAREESPEDGSAKAASEPPSPKAPPAGGSTARIPAITFSTFVLSLSTQALAHLGEIPPPYGEDLPRDLAAAQQLIDILGILQEKTTGNLDAAESGLLTHALYDLRLKYVEQAKKPTS